MKIVKVTLEIALSTPDTTPGYIADLVSAILTHNLMATGDIIDWRYSEGKPKAEVINITQLLDEGEAFQLTGRVIELG